MTRLTATQAARAFSDLLNRVARGEIFAITRNDVTVAVIAPPRDRTVSAARFRELLDVAPPVDKGFVADVRSIRAEAGDVVDHWES